MLATVLENIAAICVSVSALGGLCIALKGLGAWRDQIAGKEAFGVARRMLRGVYAVRDGLSAVRSPLMTSGEHAEARKELGMTDSPEHESPFTSTAAAYQVRWQRVQAAISDLQAAATEGEVLWGKEAVEAVEPLRKAATVLFIDLEDYVQLKMRMEARAARPGGDPDQPRRDLGQLTRLEGVVFETRSHERDTLTPKIDAAVEAAERWLRPRLLSCQ